MPPKPKQTKPLTKRPASTTLSTASARSSASTAVSIQPVPEVTPLQVYYDKILAFATIRRILIVCGATALVLMILALAVRRGDIAGVMVSRALKAENWSAAIRNIKVLYGSKPSTPEATLLLARCLVENKQPAEALKLLEASINNKTPADILEANKKSNPPLATLFLTVRGRARIAQNQADAGASDLAEALKLDPEFPMANAAMGQYYLDKKNPDLAGKFVEKLVQEKKYEPLLKQYRTMFKQKTDSVPTAELQDVPEKK